MGVLIRVHALFNNNLTGKTRLDVTDFTKAPISSLIFVTKSGNLQDGVNAMGNIPNKHVGVIKNGFVYHYGNSKDQVRKDTVPAFVTGMKTAYGGGVTFVTTDLPKA